MGQGPPSGAMHSNLIYLNSLASTHVEDCNFRLSASTGIPDWLQSESWWLGYLEYHPITSWTSSQKKFTHPAALPPDFSNKSSSLKNCWDGGGWFRLFEHDLPIVLAWPSWKTFPCSKLWLLGLLGLTVHWAHTLEFEKDNHNEEAVDIISKELRGTQSFAECKSTQNSKREG